MFTEITMFAYIIPVRCNIKILNGIKSATKGFDLVIVNPPKTNMIIRMALHVSHYMHSSGLGLYCDTRYEKLIVGVSFPWTFLGMISLSCSSN